MVRQVARASVLQSSLLRKAALAASLLVSSELHAGPDDPPDLSLAWTAPENCPQREAVLTQVRELAADAYPGDPRLRVEGTITRLESGRYVLELKLADAEGVEVRRIDANACRQLAGGAAVIVGLKLTRGASPTGQGNTSEPEDRSGAGEPLPDATASRETNSVAPKPQPSAAQTPPRARPQRDTSAFDEASERRGVAERNWWLAAPEVGVTLGALPLPLVTLQASFGRRLGAWVIAASGRYSIARSVPVDVPDVAARVQLHSAGLSIGHGWRLGVVDLEPSLAVRAHRLAARGEGEALESAASSTVVLQWGVDLNLRWAFSEVLALRTTLAAGVHTGRPRFMVDQLGEVRRLGPGQVTFSVGPELSF